MSFLAGGMKRAIGKAFGQVQLSGTLRREVPGEGVDEYSDPLPGTVETFPFGGWRETYDAAWLSAGIPSTDARLMILADTITTDPVQGDQVQFEGLWWQVRAIEGIDPAGATFALQIYEIEDPT